MTHQLFNPSRAILMTSGVIRPSWKVSFFLTGTTTPTPVYTTSALDPGAVHTQPIQADAGGVLDPIYLDPSITYKASYYDQYDVLQYTDDPVNDQFLSQAGVGGVLYPEIAQEAGLVVNGYMPYGHVLRYGTNTTPGTTDMRAALQATIDVQQAGGPDAYWPAGIYGIGSAAGDSVIDTGLLIPFVSANGTTSRVRIRTDGNATVLKALDDDMVILRVSDSHAEIDRLTLDGNSHTGVWGLGVVPEDVTQTTDVVHQLYNRISAYILSCEEGVVLQCGPRVTATDSGCWYNELDVHVYSCTRGIWLRDPPNTASQVNRNTFRGRVGQSCNTGVQIDSGSTNVFVGMHFEGIATGTSPNTTPTAVKIEASDAWSSDNNYNDFFGCFLEGNTRDLDNANPQTRIFGGSWDASKFGGGGIKPKVMIVGDASVAPLLLPGLEYGEGISGFESAYWAMSKEVADSGHNWQTYALTTSNCTNAASVGASATSRYTKRGGVVTWHGVLQFDATVDVTEVTITPPVAPAAMYQGPASRNSWYSLYVSDGAGDREPVQAGWTNAGALYIPSPGAWDTGGNNNVIWFTVEYHE